MFESAEYAARTRDNHWYVYDLYKTFLMRDPDPSGWAYWESVVPANGRENVRRAFELSVRNSRASSPLSFPTAPPRPMLLL